MIILLLFWGSYTISHLDNTFFVQVKNLSLAVGLCAIPTSIFFLDKHYLVCMHVYGTSVNEEKLVVVQLI